MSHQLAVRLTLEKKTFFVGETIPLEVRIFNSGDGPLLIGNSISTAAGSLRTPRIKFEVKNERGRISSELEMIADYPAVLPEPNPATALLRSYMLLYPGYSLVVEFPFDPTLFKFLGKPGTYTLSATYSSGGLLLPKGVGLTEEAVKSVPFASWHGTIATNEVSFRIVLRPRPKTPAKE